MHGRSLVAITSLDHRHAWTFKWCNHFTGTSSACMDVQLMLLLFFDACMFGNPSSHLFN